MKTRFSICCCYYTVRSIAEESLANCHAAIFDRYR
jgi:hypothetical protein